MSEQNSVVNAEKGDGEISSNVETASSVNPSVKPQNAIKEEAKETNGEDQKCKGPENAGSTAETKETSNDATNGMKTPEETKDTNDKRHDDEGEDEDEDEDNGDEDDEDVDSSSSETSSEDGEDSESVSGESIESSSGEDEESDESDGNTSNSSSGDESGSEEEEEEEEENAGEPAIAHQDSVPTNDSTAPRSTHTRNISLSSNGSNTNSTIILVKTTLETILNDKDIKKNSIAF